MKQNAKAAIIDSFKELLNKKSIDKITVKEICEHCDVNRQTFYNHFTDIMDIFKFIFFEELSTEIAQNRTFETWEWWISGYNELSEEKFKNDSACI